MTKKDTPSERNDSAAPSTGRIRHEWGDSDRPSTAVIEAVAAATNRDPTATSPLYDYVDPDALDRLMQSRRDGTTDAVSVSFMYDGIAVQVDSRGWVEVQLDGVTSE
ncbi:HalOD1 output domain-containing protein [Halalkalirubrum salinum]|uniref:HalOD1 output domain-containing protein n=1 Tax=Halalkalirubrum salinum TaxID=2563889 RepID=UPI0010FB9E00|nr:HalOD1 output domain-containing protein [Halalkalirubrum salinum]